jgi:hypothetical protein
MFTERRAPAQAQDPDLAQEQVQVCLSAVAPEAQGVPPRRFEAAHRFAYLVPFFFLKPFPAAPTAEE